MPIVVQKYGGSSVADLERIRKVAQRVAARSRAGAQVVVVVSAMGDTTDELLALAKQVSPDPPRRELDMLLTCGERISMALVSMALHELGVQAISFTGSQSGIITDDAHSQARIIEVRPVRIQEELGKGKVVIVAGYQGVSRQREVTTLGRGGSDTSAVALAAALGADCEIYSDVDGVFSADPRVVPDARKLETLSYEEMQALAHAGARVLNAQAVEFAREKEIVIQARSAHGAGTGTRVEAAPLSDRSGAVKSVTGRADVAVLSAPGDQPLAGVLSVLEKHGGRPLFISQAPSGTQLAVVLEDVHGLGAMKDELGRKVPGCSMRQELATVTCVGTGVGSSPALVAQALKAAAGVEVTPQVVHSSALQISLLVPPECSERLTLALHQALVLGQPR